MTRIFTLAFIATDTHILLGLKKQGFGIGKWNGFGGKVEEGENIKDGARRELYEEAGINAKNLKEVGVLHFTWKETPALPDVFEIHVFLTNEFEGEVQESEEMRPQWFAHAEIPFDKMWKPDSLWYPMLLQGKSFHGSCVLDSHNNILEQEFYGEI